MKKVLFLGAAMMAATLGMQAQKSMKAPAGGKAISDELIGIFFEDISSAADGGLYAELLQNGSFEFNPGERDGWGAGTAWKQIRPGHSLGTLQVRMDNPIHPNNPTYMRLHTERVKEYYDYKGWKGFGIENTGFNGISVKAGEKYDFSAFFRIPSAISHQPSRSVSHWSSLRDGAKTPSSWQRHTSRSTLSHGRSARLSSCPRPTVRMLLCRFWCSPWATSISTRCH